MGQIGRLRFSRLVLGLVITVIVLTVSYTVQTDSNSPLPVGPRPVLAGCGPGEVFAAAVEAPGDGHYLGYGFCVPASFCAPCGAQDCGKGVPNGFLYCGAPPPPPPPPPVPNKPMVDAGPACLGGTSRTVTLSGNVDSYQIQMNPGGVVVNGASYTFTGLQAGIGYTFNGQAFNGSGGSGWSDPVGPVYQDTQAPTTAFNPVGTAGSNGWWRSNVSVALLATDADCLGVKQIIYALDGAAAVYTSPFPVNGDGTHSLTYASTDGTNTEAPQNQTIRIDTVAPTLSLTPSRPPDSSSGWYRSPVDVTLATSDTTSGVASQQVNIDNQGWTAYTGTITFGTDAKHTLNAQVVDVAGNQSATGVVVRVDMAAPQTTASLSGQLGQNSWFTSSTVTITLTATDATSGVFQTLLSIDGTMAKYTGPVTITGEGSHSIDYASVDVAGNVEATHHQTVLIDSVAPSLTLTPSRPPDSPTGWWRSPVSVSVTSSDATSGIASQQVNLDNQGWAPYDGNPILLTSDLQHTASIKITDIAGNSTTQSLTIPLDQTNPHSTLSFSDPVGGDAWHLTSPVKVALMASDATSGVVRSTYAVDGQGGTYTGPFEVSGDGVHWVTYQSFDAAGNAEPMQQFPVSIDTVAPNLDSYQCGPSVIGLGEDYGIQASVADNASGSRSVSLQLTSSQGQSFQADAASFSNFPLSAATGLYFSPSANQVGSYTVSLSITDRAGHTTQRDNLCSFQVTTTLPATSTGTAISRRRPTRTPTPTPTDTATTTPTPTATSTSTVPPTNTPRATVTATATNTPHKSDENDQTTNGTGLSSAALASSGQGISGGVQSPTSDSTPTATASPTGTPSATSGMAGMNNSSQPPIPPVGSGGNGSAITTSSPSTNDPLAAALAQAALLGGAAAGSLALTAFASRRKQELDAEAVQDQAKLQTDLQQQATQSAQNQAENARLVAAAEQEAIVLPAISDAMRDYLGAMAQWQAWADDRARKEQALWDAYVEQQRAEAEAEEKAKAAQQVRRVYVPAVPSTPANWIAGAIGGLTNAISTVGHWVTNLVSSHEVAVHSYEAGTRRAVEAQQKDENFSHYTPPPPPPFLGHYVAPQVETIIPARRELPLDLPVEADPNYIAPNTIAIQKNSIIGQLTALNGGYVSPEWREMPLEKLEALLRTTEHGLVVEAQQQDDTHIIAVRAQQTQDNAKERASLTSPGMNFLVNITGDNPTAAERHLYDVVSDPGTVSPDTAPPSPAELKAEDQYIQDMSLGLALYRQNHPRPINGSGQTDLHAYAQQLQNITDPQQMADFAADEVKKNIVLTEDQPVADYNGSLSYSRSYSTLSPEEQQDQYNYALQWVSPELRDKLTNLSGLSLHDRMNLLKEVLKRNNDISILYMTLVQARGSYQQNAGYILHDLTQMSPDQLNALLQVKDFDHSINNDAVSNTLQQASMDSLTMLLTQDLGMQATDDWTHSTLQEVLNPAFDLTLQERYELGVSIVQSVQAKNPVIRSPSGARDKLTPIVQQFLARVLLHSLIENSTDAGTLAKRLQKEIDGQTPGNNLVYAQIQVSQHDAALQKPLYNYDANLSRLHRENQNYWMLGDKRAHDRYAALLLIGIGASPEMFGGLLHGTSEELSSFDAYNRFVRRFSPDDTNAGTGKNQNEDSTQSSTSEGNNGDPGGSGVTPNTTLPSSSSIGATRVQKVVDHFGDEVVATQKIIKIPGVGSTDIDVELTGNRYIEVGGPAKGASKDALSKFGGQLRKISIYAQQQGGKAYFYYDAGTSQEAIDLAVRWFGEGSVFPLPK